jgi:uncharacterized OB-fold protein
MTSSEIGAASAGLKVWKCDACGALYFPAHLICYRCGSSDWTSVRIYEGTIEESTRSPGAKRSNDTLLATINAADLRVIAALEAPLPDGARVVLKERNGAPWAFPADPG